MAEKIALPFTHVSAITFQTRAISGMIGFFLQASVPWRWGAFLLKLRWAVQITNRIAVGEAVSPTPEH